LNPLPLFSPTPLDTPPLRSFPTRRSSDLGATIQPQTRRSQHFAFARDPWFFRFAPRLPAVRVAGATPWRAPPRHPQVRKPERVRSEEHTSELQSPDHLVCRLLLEKKKKQK